MISAIKFYSATLRSRLNTISGAQDHVAHCNTKNVVTLPPVSGNIDQGSDTESVPYNLEIDDAIL